jgi:hypothetical protein
MKCSLLAYDINLGWCWCDNELFYFLGLLLMSVATKANDGFLRFANTANRYGYNLQVVKLILDNIIIV